MISRDKTVYKKNGWGEARSIRGMERAENMELWESADCQGSTGCLGEQTFAEWLEVWLDERKTDLKASTYATYRNQLEHHIKPSLGTYRLSQVTGNVVQRYLNEKLSSGRLDGRGGLSTATVQLHRHIISAAIAEAQRCHLVGERLVVFLRKARDEGCAVQVYSREEQFCLTETLKCLGRKNPRYWGPLLSLYTGLRVGELAALQWGDICFEKRVIHVRRTLQRITNVEQTAEQPKTRIVVGPPKSLSALRLLPMTMEMMSLLRNYYNSLSEQARAPEAFLFQYRGRYVEPRTFERYQQRAAREAKVPNLKFHALRHTFATRAIESGMDVKALSELLGHSNIQITLNVYVHSLMEHKRNAMESLQLYLNRELPA